MVIMILLEKEKFFLVNNIKGTISKSLKEKDLPQGVFWVSLLAIISTIFLDEPQGTLVVKASYLGGKIVAILSSGTAAYLTHGQKLIPETKGILCVQVS